MLTTQEIIKARTPRTSAARPNARPRPARSAQLRLPPAVGKAIVRVEAEYREMPGLNLTLPQAARLLGIDRYTCELVLTRLVERGVLRRTLDGTYVRY